VSAHLFVTGTDTGVGKTVATCVIIRALAAKGFRVAAMKPVAAGLVQQEGEWLSQDVIAHAECSNVVAPLALRQPVALMEPMAPHIAAARAGKTIELAPIVAAARTLEAMCDVVVAEGAGGLLVPLNDYEDTRDLAVQLGYRVVLVVGMRLGCLNHARLTVEALAARSIPLAGWIANEIEPAMTAFEDNVARLKASISAPCLAMWRHGAVGDVTVAPLVSRNDRRNLTSATDAVASTPQGCT
jgi:dethiobiotin synthetase